MTVTVRQLANLVQGDVFGDHDVLVESASTLQDAQRGDITLLENADQAADLRESKACAAVVSANLPTCGKALIRVKDPRSAFAAIVRHLTSKALPGPTGIDPRAFVDPSAHIGVDPSIDSFVVVGMNTTIGKRCQLHRGVVIGRNCLLGDDVVLHPNVVLYDDTVIGNCVTIHARSSIGADGFGYRFRDGRHVKVPQLGNVVIGDDVELGAGSSVDRGAFGSTTICDGAKIGNLSQIAHNCRIGPNNLIASHVGIGGSSVTGANLDMGDQAGIRDHMTVGDNVVLDFKTGVVQSVPEDQRMTWYPAHEEHEAVRFLADLGQLPTMEDDLLRVLERLGMPQE